MKKKIRDLTLEEYKKFCAKYIEVCANCPFGLVMCSFTSDKFWMKHKDLYSDKFLDQKIEVGE